LPREHALGQAIDRRTDVWAVGAVLHFLLAGEHPFEGATPLDTLRRVMNGETPRALPASVPSAVAAAVKRALSHDMDTRFESAAAMRTALLAAAEEHDLDTGHEAVAAFVAEPLAEPRATRAALVTRALHDAPSRSGLAVARPSAAPVETPAPAPAEPIAAAAATLGSTTIEHAPRPSPQRVVWTVVGVAAFLGTVGILARSARPEAPASTPAAVAAPPAAAPAPEANPTLAAPASAAPPPVAVVVDAQAPAPQVTNPATNAAHPSGHPAHAAAPPPPPATPPAHAATPQSRRDYGF
jgi:serine/threonine-protein kinase